MYIKSKFILILKIEWNTSHALFNEANWGYSNRTDKNMGVGAESLAREHCFSFK
jgi:hypothetical protein